MQNISQFVSGQFPKIYQEEYPLYVNFAQLYYKWLETKPGSIYYNRNFLDLTDVDTATDDLLVFLKEEFLKNIQFNTEVNLRILIKHSLDLYRSKGTEQSIDLLFRIIFNEIVNIYYPSEDLFIASDGEWKTPKYLELSLSVNNQLFYQKQIVGISSGATAFVDSLIRKNINNKLHDIAYISSITGFFQTGERIKIIDDQTNQNLGLIIGSLNQVTFDSTGEGSGFEVGDIVNIYSNRGDGGIGRVSAVTSSFGEVNNSLTDGGYGFSNASTVYVSNNILTIDSIALTSPQYNNLFNMLDTVTQPLISIDYISSNNTFTNGSNVYTYFANNSLKGIGVIANNVSVNSTSGTLLISTVSGNLQSNQIFAYGNLISANVSNGSYADITASGKYIGTKFTRLTCNSQTLNGSFNVNDYVYCYNQQIPNDISVIASGYVSNVYSDSSNNLIVKLTNINGVFVNNYTLMSSTSNATIKYVDTQIGVSNLTNQFVNSPFAYFYSDHCNGYVTSVFSKGAGTNLIIEEVSSTETILINDDLLSTFESLSLNSNSYGFVANSSGNLINMPINSMMSYSNLSIGEINKFIGYAGKNYNENPIIFINQTNVAAYDKYSPILNISNVTSSFAIGEVVTQSSSNARGRVISSNSSELIIKQMRFNQNNQFLLTTNNTTKITGTLSGATANVDQISFQYDNYQTGRNAIVATSINDSNGAIVSIDVIDSGIGYINDNQVWINRDNKSEQRSNTAFGYANLYTYGTGTGFYNKEGGFLSDNKKLFDGDYYQNFSYEIQSSKSIDKYNKIIKQTTHVAGKKLFGKFIHKKSINSNINADKTEIVIG